MRLFWFLFITFSTGILCSSQQAYPPLRLPLELTSVFAEYRKNHFHSGIDLRMNNKADKSVFSIWEGYVSRIRFNSASYGRAVYVTHPNGYTSVYGHLDSFSEKIDSVVYAYQLKNQVFETDIELDSTVIRVSRGQVLGIAGNSGYSFGAHLHFEIRDTKTQDPLNPLHFYTLNDDIDPVFYQLNIYRLQKGGFLPATTQSYKIIKKGAIFSTYSEILVPDTFFLGVDVQDYQSLLYFRLLPETIEWFIDDSLFMKMTFYRFRFDRTGSCRGVFDHQAGLNHKKQIVTTFTGNHPEKGLYSSVNNNGLLIINDSQPHKLTIKATDTEFNTSIFQTSIRKNNVLMPALADPYEIHSTFFHEYETPSVTLRLDTATFYGDMALKEPIIIESGTADKKVWKIGFPEIPLVKPMTVLFNNDSMIGEKTLWAQMDQHRIEKVWKPQRNQEGQWFVMTDRPGYYQLIEDTIAPTIGKTNITATGKATLKNEITFTVTDNSGTIARFNAYINDHWVLMIYDLKYDAFSIPLSSSLKQELKVLKVVFSDLSGNETVKEYVF